MKKGRKENIVNAKGKRDFLTEKSRAWFEYAFRIRKHHLYESSFYDFMLL